VKRVSSGQEPEILKKFRAANPSGTWDQFRHEEPGYNQVLDSLAAAQGYICAYCEIDLRGPLYRQVEHFQPKRTSSPDRNLHLEFANLLACCEGGTIRWNKDRTEGPIPETMHCGQLKSDRTPDGRMLDPRSIPPSPSFWRTTRGELLVDPEACSTTGVDPGLLDSTVTFLGLNRRGLVRLRETLVASLDSEAQEDLSSDSELLQRMYVVAARNLLPDPDGGLPRFWSTIRAWAGSGIEPFVLENLTRIPGLS
jgi:uncharacterized protein (TIGR02646 family)